MMSQDFAQFLKTPSPAELGPQRREGTRTSDVLNQQLEPLLKNSQFPDENQQLIRALLLLWHDDLATAHRIAQEIDTADGAFVHGIMHRREPDFGNAAYWFRRVGRHSSFERLAARVSELVGSAREKQLAERLVPGGNWDPFGFIKACEALGNKPGPERERLKEVQRIEFEELLSHLQQAGSSVSGER